MFDDADLSRSENGRFIQIGNLPDVFVARRSGRKSDPAMPRSSVKSFRLAFRIGLSWNA